MIVKRPNNVEMSVRSDLHCMNFDTGQLLEISWRCFDADDARNKAYSFHYQLTYHLKRHLMTTEHIFVDCCEGYPKILWEKVLK